MSTHVSDDDAALELAIEREARAAEDQEKYDADVDVAARAEAVKRDARARAARAEATRQMRIPASQDDYSLAADAAYVRDLPEETFAVAELLKRDQNATLTAAYKTGKTGMVCDLGRCVANGEPFLGRFDVNVEGNVGFINAEMTRKDWTDYVTALGVNDPGRIRAWHLRGYRIPLLSDVGAEKMIDWLTRNEVGLWVFDSHARACSWSGVSENDNDEVGVLLQRLDEIKVVAGVHELVYLAHTGRKEHAAGFEHARGATVLDDWPDARLIYTKDDHGARFLRAEGRGVELDETEVQRDAATGRLEATGATRAQAKTDREVDEVFQIVFTQEGQKTGEVQKAMTTTTNATRRAHAVQRAVSEGKIHAVPSGPAKMLYVGPSPATS